MLTSFPSFLLDLKGAEESFSETLPYGKLEELIMTEPFIGQIAMVAFDFAPDGWFLCNGECHPITTATQVLADILQGSYGQCDENEFRVPDLRGRIPLGINPMPGNSSPASGVSTYTLGETGGTEEVQLTEANLPEVQAKLRATNADSNSTSPSESALLSKPRSSIYATGATSFVEMDCIVGIGSGSNTPVNNRQPYLAINFIIAYQGIDPRT